MKLASPIKIPIVSVRVVPVNAPIAEAVYAATYTVPIDALIGLIDYGR